MPKYRVYREDAPGDYVIIEADGYFSMSIKTRAIETSDKFSWADYTALKVRRAKDDLNPST